jgi:hypothetical protein
MNFRFSDALSMPTRAPGSGALLFCGGLSSATVVTRSPDRMPESYRSERLQVLR